MRFIWFYFLIFVDMSLQQQIHTNIYKYLQIEKRNIYPIAIYYKHNHKYVDFAELLYVNYNGMILYLHTRASDNTYIHACMNLMGIL